MKALRSVLFMLLVAFVQNGKAQHQVDDLITRGIDYRVYDLPAETRSLSSFTPITTELVSYTADGKVYLAGAGSKDHRLMYRAAAAGITGVTPFTSTKDTCLILSLVTPRKTYLTRSDVLPMDTAATIAVLPSGIYELQSYRDKALFAYGVTRKNSRGVVWKYNSEGPSVQFAGNSPVTGLVLINENEMYVSSGNALYHVKQGAPKPSLIRKWDEPVTGLTYDSEKGWFVSLASKVIRYQSIDEQGEILTGQINGPLAIIAGQLFVLWREGKKIVRLDARNEVVHRTKEQNQKMADLAIEYAEFYSRFEDTEVFVEKAISYAERHIGKTNHSRFLLARYKYRQALSDFNRISPYYTMPNADITKYLRTKWESADSFLKGYEAISTIDDSNSIESKEIRNCIDTHLKYLNELIVKQAYYILCNGLKNNTLYEGANFYTIFDLKKQELDKIFQDLESSKYKIDKIIKENEDLKITVICNFSEKISILDKFIKDSLNIEERSEFLNISKEFKSGIGQISENYLKTYNELRSNKSKGRASLANLHMNNIVNSTNTLLEASSMVSNDMLGGMIAGGQLITGLVDIVQQGRINKEMHSEAIKENRYIHTEYTLQLMRSYQNSIGKFVTNRINRSDQIFENIIKTYGFVGLPDTKTSEDNVFAFFLQKKLNSLIISEPFKISKINTRWDIVNLLEYIYTDNIIENRIKPIMLKEKIVLENLLPIDPRKNQKGELLNSSYFKSIEKIDNFDSILSLAKENGISSKSKSLNSEIALIGCYKDYSEALSIQRNIVEYILMNKINLQKININ